jgi:uncharacterized protein (DUF305 family)
MAGMSGKPRTMNGSADETLISGMSQMNRAMATAPMTGNPDEDFVAMMVPHHQTAVSMAEVELCYRHDLFLRKVAQEISTAQTHEILEMTAWLK